MNTTYFSKRKPIVNQKDSKRSKSGQKEPAIAMEN